MRFVKVLTVTAGSTKSSPSRDSILLSNGMLYHMEVAFPPGPGNWVSVVVLDGNVQIAPANPDGVFNWNDYTLSFTMNYPLTDVPYKLLLRGWSPDAIFDHNITFRFDVQPTEKDDRKALLDYLHRLLVMPGR